MPKRKSRAYYQYMLDVCDQKVSYYSTDDISLIVYDLLDDNEEEEALNACEKGLDQHPGDEFVQIVKAKVLSRMKRFAESEQLLKGNPEKDSPFGIGIRFAIEVNSLGEDEALTHLVTHFEQRELLPQEVVDIIDENFDNLHHDVTSIHLQRIAQRLAEGTLGNEDQTAEALGRIGAMLMDCNCHREAIPVLEKALDIDAYDVYSWQDLSRCQLDLKMFDECEQSCEMGLAIDPTNPLFNYALGFIHCERQEYAEGIEMLEMVRQYFEGNIRHEDIHLDRHEMEHQCNVTYEVLGFSYQAINEVSKAIDCYQTLVRRLPGFAEGYYRLGLLLIEQGDLGQAKKCYDVAAELEDGNPTYLLAKAQMSLAFGRKEEADRTFRSLLKHKPDDELSLAMVRSYFEEIGDEEALKKLNN